MIGKDSKEKLILITGPTATGKTKMSIHLAKYLKTKGINAHVINFDSLLFYQEIAIGTAKPTDIEMDEIPHHLISISSISNELNAYHYVKLAKELISNLHSQEITPILVGGSAFYLRALMKGMYEEDSATTNCKEIVKQKWKNTLAECGINPIIEFLQLHDPQALALYHSNDHYRLTRAAEHFEITGNKISDQKKEFDDNAPYDFSTSQYNFIHFYLDLPKNDHYPYIIKRVDEMIHQGLIDEVKILLEQNYDTNLKPLQSIGYKETIDFLMGKLKNLDELKELIAIHTRQLAKSQRTFFKKIKPKIELNPLIDHEKMEILTLNFLKNCE